MHGFRRTLGLEGCRHSVPGRSSLTFQNQPMSCGMLLVVPAENGLQLQVDSRIGSSTMPASVVGHILFLPIPETWASVISFTHTNTPSRYRAMLTSWRRCLLHNLRRLGVLSPFSFRTQFLLHDVDRKRFKQCKSRGLSFKSTLFGYLLGLRHT